MLVLRRPASKWTVIIDRPDLIEGNMSAKECKELHLCVDRKPSSMSSETDNVLLRLFKYRFYRNNLKFIPLVKKK